MELDLPDSTNGALLVLSVAGFGLSVYFREVFLSYFFFGIMAVTAVIWLFFLSLSMHRNLKVLEEASTAYNDLREEFLFFFLKFIGVVIVIFIAGLAFMSALR